MRTWWHFPAGCKITCVIMSLSPSTRMGSSGISASTSRFRSVIFRSMEISTRRILADVEVLSLPQGVDGLQLAHVQHPPHQPAQAAALVGDDLEILPLVLRRDGAVQNAVCIAGDGGHGRLQLMGDVGDELPPLALRLLQVLRHVVEGGRQLSQLVIRP